MPRTKKPKSRLGSPVIVEHAVALEGSSHSVGAAIYTDLIGAAFFERPATSRTRERKKRDYIATMRAQIAAHPQGRTAKSTKLLEGVNRKAGLAALRKLEALGEYDGFAVKRRRASL